MKTPHGSPTSLPTSVTHPDFVPSLHRNRPVPAPASPRNPHVPGVSWRSHPAPAPPEPPPSGASRGGHSRPGPPRDARDLPRTAAPGRRRRLLDDGDDVAGADRGTFGDVQGGDFARSVSGDLVLHLHRLDHTDQVTL